MAECLLDVMQVLEGALALPGVQTPVNAEQALRLSRKGCLPSLHERAHVYLQLADVCTKLGKSQDCPEARKVNRSCSCSPLQGLCKQSCKLMNQPFATYNCMDNA